MTDKMLNVKVISFNENMLVSINRGMTVYCMISMHFFAGYFIQKIFFYVLQDRKKAWSSDRGQQKTLQQERFTAEQKCFKVLTLHCNALDF